MRTTTSNYENKCLLVSIVSLIPVSRYNIVYIIISVKKYDP